jgi:hypothetical protein
VRHERHQLTDRELSFQRAFTFINIEGRR